MSSRNLIEDRWAEALDRKIEVERRASERLLRLRLVAHEADSVVLPFAAGESDRAFALEIRARKYRQSLQVAERLPIKSPREAAEAVFTRPTLTLVSRRLREGEGQ